MTDHPITPPPELVEQWLGQYFGTTVTGEISDVEIALATSAARWGADQELEACCEWLSVPCPSYGRELRAARRPKPPSLAEQALALVEQHEDGCWRPSSKDWVVIRRAVQRLQELEGAQ